MEAQLAKLREEYKAIKPEEIKVIDPCMGSGHILVYAFDVLMQIYTSAGWDQREAAQSILKNNLFGLDIDDRAAQLAYFAVMMKARQYDRRLLTRGIQPNIYSIRESNGIQAMTIEYFHKNDPKLKADIGRIVTEMRDAKEYGSILNITPVDFAGLYARFDEIREDINMMQMSALDELLPLVKCAELLAQKYDVVVTNPPYMGSGGMSDKLVALSKRLYPNVKSDLFSICIQKMIGLTRESGLFAYIAPQSWMFLSTQEGLRNQLLHNATLSNLIDLGINAFDSGFGTATAVFSKTNLINQRAVCLDLTVDGEKEKLFLANDRKTYVCSSATFTDLPRKIFSYSCVEEFSRWFKHKNIGDYSTLDCGIKTGNNNLFVRLWHEVSISKTAYRNSSLSDIESGKYKWFKYSQGGGFHRWYGAIENVVDLEYDAANIKTLVNKSTYRLRDKSKYYLPGMVWPMVGTDNFSSRFLPEDVLPDIASNVLYCVGEYEWKLLAYLNSKVFNKFITLINPTVNYPIDSVAAVPYELPSPSSQNEIISLSKENVLHGKQDWDSLETSWDFKRNPLV